MCKAIETRCSCTSPLHPPPPPGSAFTDPLLRWVASSTGSADIK